MLYKSEGWVLALQRPNEYLSFWRLSIVNWQFLFANSESKTPGAQKNDADEDDDNDNDDGQTEYLSF